MYFTFRLKHYRQLKGLTQEQLADKTGLSQQFISELEKYNRTKSPTLDTVAILALALEICPYSLMEFNHTQYCKKYKTCEIYSAITNY